MEKKNKVELLGYYGNDEVIACSAWTSTSRELTEDKRSRIPGLLNMLWSNGHETPYEKCTLHFLVDTEIATHIHLLKHRISSLNAESARYKELKEDKYYLPEDWNGIVRSDTHGQKDEDDCIPAIAMPDEQWLTILENYTKLGNKLYHECLEDLTPVLGRKRAKESARFFKTYNSQIQADVMFNLRSFKNFLDLRNSKHAQKEVREVAAEMLELMKNIEGNPFKYTLAAWGY